MQQLWSNSPQVIADILLKFTYLQNMVLTANLTENCEVGKAG